MVIIPKEKPVIEKLNSYYVNLKRLFEHYQGELGSGTFHFKALSSEGAVFFDKDVLLGGVYQDKEGQVTGKKAIDRIMNEAPGNNFNIGVYAIDPEKIYYWASLPASNRIFADLSTEFTDLEGLINKMAAEKLTGYIEVVIDSGEEGGYVFFHGGQIIGGAYSWGNGTVDGSEENRIRLIEMTKASKGVFHVSKIEVAKEEKKQAPEPRDIHPPAGNALDALERLLKGFEDMVEAGNRNKGNFSLLLRKKFVENADRFSFLDPFAGEFEYLNRKISVVGDISNHDLIEGVLTSVAELAEDLGMLTEIKESLGQVLEKHGEGISIPGILA